METFAYMPEPHELQMIDVFLPDDPNGGCIFFIHGGGWRGGDKESWHRVAEHFSSRGYVCTCCDYRLSPNVLMEGILRDVRAAMSWVKERADEFDFATDRVAAYGSSAGGHLAGMLATISPDSGMGMTDQVTIRDTRPNAAVCMCPVMALDRFDPDRLPELLGRKWASDQQRTPLASPEYRITGQEPPFLIVVGAEDETTSPSDQQAFKSAVDAAGGSCELVVIDGAPHGAFYGISTDAQKAALPYVEDFIDRTIGPGGAQKPN